MKKLAMIIGSVVLVAFFAGLGNASEYEKRERRRSYEHGERYENKFYGTVEQIPEDLIGTWVVDGKNIQVTQDTYIDKEQGQPGVGSYVEVEGIYIDNIFKAQKIEVKGKNR